MLHRQFKELKNVNSAPIMSRRCMCKSFDSDDPVSLVVISDIPKTVLGHALSRVLFLWTCLRLREV